MAKSRKELAKKWVFWFLVTVTTFLLFFTTMALLQLPQFQGVPMFAAFVFSTGASFFSSYFLMIATVRLLLPLFIGGEKK
jgi:hypothetical protein